MEFLVSAFCAALDSSSVVEARRTAVSKLAQRVTANDLNALTAPRAGWPARLQLGRMLLLEHAQGKPFRVNSPLDAWTAVSGCPSLQPIKGRPFQQQAGLVDFAMRFPREVRAAESILLADRLLQEVDHEALGLSKSGSVFLGSQVRYVPNQVALTALRQGVRIQWATRVQQLVRSGMSIEELADDLSGHLTKDRIESAVDEPDRAQGDRAAQRRWILRGGRPDPDSPVNAFKAIPASSRFKALLDLWNSDPHDREAFERIREVVQTAPIVVDAHISRVTGPAISTELRFSIREGLMNAQNVPAAAQVLQRLAHDEPTQEWDSALRALAHRYPVIAARGYVGWCTQQSILIDLEFANNLASKLATQTSSEPNENVLAALDKDPRDASVLTELFQEFVMRQLRADRTVTSGDTVSTRMGLHPARRRRALPACPPEPPTPTGAARYDGRLIALVFDVPRDDGGQPIVALECSVDAGPWRPIHYPLMINRDLTTAACWIAIPSQPERVAGDNSPPSLIRMRSVGPAGPGESSAPIEVSPASQGIDIGPWAAANGWSHWESAGFHASSGVLDSRQAFGSLEPPPVRALPIKAPILPRPPIPCRQIALAIRSGIAPDNLPAHVCALHAEDAADYDWPEIMRATDELKAWQLDSTPANSSVVESVQEQETGRTARSWQIAAFEAWINHGRWGIVEAVTGSGKSFLAKLAIRDALDQGLGVVIIVNTVVLRDQWLESLASFFPIGTRIDRAVNLIGGGGPNMRPPAGRISLAVINTLSGDPEHFRPSTEDFLLIADEVHNYGGEQFFKAFLPDRYRWRLGLTATLEGDVRAMLKLRGFFGGSPCYSYDFSEAIRDKSVSGYELCIIRVPLSAGEQAEYKEFRRRQLAARQGLAECGYRIKKESEFRQRLQRLRELPGEAGRYAQKYHDAGEDIDGLLARSQEKPEALRSIAPLLAEHGPSVLFTDYTETMKSCERILVEQGVVCRIFHGELPREERLPLLRDLTYGQPVALIAPQVLDEGLDIPALEVGVMVGSGRQRRRLIQRLGRIVRIDPQKRFPIMFALVGMDTADDPGPDEASSVTDDDRLEASAFDFYWREADRRYVYSLDPADPLRQGLLDVFIRDRIERL